jgi:hypothetical protein
LRELKIRLMPVANIRLKCPTNNTKDQIKIPREFSKRYWDCSFPQIVLPAPTVMGKLRAYLNYVAFFRDTTPVDFWDRQMCIKNKLSTIVSLLLQSGYFWNIQKMWIISNIKKICSEKFKTIHASISFHLHFNFIASWTILYV